MKYDKAWVETGTASFLKWRRGALNERESETGGGTKAGLIKCSAKQSK